MIRHRCDGCKKLKQYVDTAQTRKPGTTGDKEEDYDPEALELCEECLQSHHGSYRIVKPLTIYRRIFSRCQR